MANRIFSSLFTALLFGAISVITSPAQAQWAVVKTFPSQVESVYFLDQQGTGTTGFVGLANSTIWRTTDNGVTWNQATTPSTAFPSEITDFAFRNTLQGWCSVRSVNNLSGAIWETTDGGLSWTSVFSGGAFVSIGYCTASNMLTAPCWNANGYQSTDFGVTWNTFAPASQNGVTYSGSMGFVGILNAPSTLYSTDGGMTWNDAPSLHAETWSPYALPGTSTFVAVAEKTNQFFISTNGGALWTNPYTFFPTPIGCIRGTSAILYVQTVNNGFYCSIDAGKDWLSICGPENNRDTRFYAVDSQIFAGDEAGNLWYIHNALAAATATVHLDKTTIAFSGVRCSATDSTIHISAGTSCTAAVLTKAQFISGGQTFSVPGIGLPWTLTGIDSFLVQYVPSPSLKDSGKLLLEFNLGTSTLDTIITLYGTAKNSTSFSINPLLALSAPYACTAKDSMIVIHNYSCDTLTVTGASLSDSSHFQLLPLTLPQVIPPRSSDTVFLLASSLTNGNFTSELALRMMSGSTITIADTVPLTLAVSRSGSLDVGSLALSALDACASIDTLLPLTASPCDSIELLTISLSDTSIFHLGAFSLPKVIPASDGVNLNIHVTPGSQGTDSTQLTIRYQSGTARVDTTVTLSLQVLYNIPVQVGLEDTLFKMGVVNAPCSDASRWITFSNSECRDLTIENIAWEHADSEYSFDQKSFPITLVNDSGIDSILVHFKPASVDTSSNRLRITLDLAGEVVDTFLTVSGVGISAFHDSLLTPALAFDTLLACHALTLEGQIVNLSCDTVIATSVALNNGTNYTVTNPSFPVAMPPGDTLHIFIALQPKENGGVTDSAIVTIHDPIADSDHLQTISLTGYVIPSSHLLALSGSAFSFNSIAPCGSLDSSFVLTNLGNCDDVILSDTTLAGDPGVTFTLPFALPLILPPDSSVRITFHVVPGDTLASTQLALVGQNIDTLIAFSYASLPGGHALAFSVPDSVFVTRPCVPVSKTFWIANVGCNPVSVDSILLHALPVETQFTLDTLLTGLAMLAPGDTLYYTVQFDPNGSGDGVALLDVSSREVNYDRAIVLSGSIIGTVPSARIALEASGGSMQCSGAASDTTSIAAVLLDDIGDTTGLQTIALTLYTNRDLLTLAKIVPAPGWSLMDTLINPNGSMELRVRHIGGGAAQSGTEFVRCYFTIAVTDSIGCDIGMSGLRFNDTSQNYEGCVLASIAMPEPVRFTETDACGTPLLRTLLDGHIALGIISVRPNPVSLLTGSAHVDLCFQLASAGVVTITLTDMLGREEWRTTVNCPAGTQTLPLELPNIPEGSCFLQVSSAGMKDSRKVAFEGAMK